MQHQSADCNNMAHEVSSFCFVLKAHVVVSIQEKNVKMQINHLPWNWQKQVSAILYFDS